MVGLMETATMGRLETCAILSLAAAAAVIPAAAADDIRNMAVGRFTFELRPRYNLIEETDKPETTRGFTQRTTLGWQGIAAAAPQLRLTAELIHAGPFAQEDFNTNPANRSSPYPLLPDPDHTGANRAFVDFTGIESTRVRAGRQVVRLGNQRWVSDNDFRQVPQLFDGVSVTHAGFANLALEAGHYRHVRETSGARKALRLGVVEAAWNPAPDHALSTYGVFHEQRDNAAQTGFANESYRVVGVRAEGTALRWRGMDVVYTAEYARQRPYAGGDSRIDADYWRVGGGFSTPRWTVRYDHEKRGSNNGVYGLQAPLTDHYGWNGWSLHFFLGPREGLVDRWLTARWGHGPVTLYAEAHRFRSDFGDLDFGRETDLGLTWELLPGLVARLQHARYEPGTGRPDPQVRKTWLTLHYEW
jgi:hypothetical protein